MKMAATQANAPRSRFATRLLFARNNTAPSNIACNAPSTHKKAKTVIEPAKIPPALQVDYAPEIAERRLVFAVCQEQSRTDKNGPGAVHQHEPARLVSALNTEHSRRHTGGQRVHRSGQLTWAGGAPFVPSYPRRVADPFLPFWFYGS